MRNSKKGFTIIEMVIVIAIIGILASVLIPTYGNVVASANESAALQTARSTMTNWLASSTSESGVPTSGKVGTYQFYAAYFESKQADHVYQYRYTSGGVERTDDNTSYYVDFAHAPIVGGTGVTYTATTLVVKYEKAYFNHNVANFDEDTYYVNVYRVYMGTSGTGADTKNDYFYYIEYPAIEGGAYNYGCTVYSGLTNGSMKVDIPTTSGETTTWDNTKTLADLFPASQG
ncbi:MAG: type II secretion system protein [Oscillospiraceae bacterium]|nr:type II secretion system protein [Oscillospiraceae bacterium]